MLERKQAVYNNICNLILIDNVPKRYINNSDNFKKIKQDKKYKTETNDVCVCKELCFHLILRGMIGLKCKWFSAGQAHLVQVSLLSCHLAENYRCKIKTLPTTQMHQVCGA